MDFSEKTIVITGASGGIGQAFAHKLAEQGARLLLVARDANKLKELTTALNAYKTENKHQWLSADVTTEYGREMLLSRADEIKANVLVNNAGVSQFNRLENISEQAFKEAVDINLLAPIFLTKSFFQLGDTTGKIVINVGSALGSIGYPFYTSYCATKFGLKGFTEALQRELSQSKNQVLYFAPRATATSINSKAVDMMNKQLGNHVDQPQWVAQALVQQLSSLNKRKSLGWPEKLFARLNGLFPELVDRAIAKQMPILKNFI